VLQVEKTLGIKQQRSALALTTHFGGKPHLTVLMLPPGPSHYQFRFVAFRVVIQLIQHTYTEVLGRLRPQLPF
jgi:hypothetical protein